ncbi:hypothetical protein EDC01DRAFT_239891 [Geopyxis carbonaria]|nr:hypothetical protein EDC01DRAFT_239891 [Geopyxis carbonaria]
MAKEPPKSDSKAKEGVKKKKGFSVGPANLPDGTYKRKVDKIKKTLIRKAKAKKQYSKIISAENPAADPHALRAQKLLEEAEQERIARRKQQEEEKSSPAPGEDSQPPAVHPDRQAAIDNSDSAEQPAEERPNERRGRRPKTSSYKKEKEYAQKIKEEREHAIKAAEERRKERERKEKQRESRRRTMNARTRTGQFKLGKMSHILLEKVQEQMAKN